MKTTYPLLAVCFKKSDLFILPTAALVKQGYTHLLKLNYKFALLKDVKDPLKPEIANFTEQGSAIVPINTTMLPKIMTFMCPGNNPDQLHYFSMIDANPTPGKGQAFFLGPLPHHPTSSWLQLVDASHITTTDLFLALDKASKSGKETSTSAPSSNKATAKTADPTPAKTLTEANSEDFF